MGGINKTLMRTNIKAEAHELSLSKHIRVGPPVEKS